jgi:hypothetical protein
MEGEKPMNMPYYLHKSLSKMSEFIRKKKRPETSLYHKGLIMMIINAELERMRISWSTFMGQPLTKPRAIILPPKKRSIEATIVGSRRSTKVSKNVLGTTSIVEIDTKSKEGSDNEQLVEKSKEKREQDDIMIDLITKPEEVEPPNMDSEKSWTGLKSPLPLLPHPRS